MIPSIRSSRQLHRAIFRKSIASSHEATSYPTTFRTPKLHQSSYHHHNSSATCLSHHFPHQRASQRGFSVKKHAIPIGDRLITGVPPISIKPKPSTRRIFELDTGPAPPVPPPSATPAEPIPPVSSVQPPALHRNAPIPRPRPTPSPDHSLSPSSSLLPEADVLPKADPPTRRPIPIPRPTPPANDSPSMLPPTTPLLLGNHATPPPPPPSHRSSPGWERLLRLVRNRSQQPSDTHHPPSSLPPVPPSRIKSIIGSVKASLPSLPQRSHIPEPDQIVKDYASSKQSSFVDEKRTFQTVLSDLTAPSRQRRAVAASKSQEVPFLHDTALQAELEEIFKQTAEELSKTNSILHKTYLRFRYACVKHLIVNSDKVKTDIIHLEQQSIINPQRPFLSYPKFFVLLAILLAVAVGVSHYKSHLWFYHHFPSIFRTIHNSPQNPSSASNIAKVLFPQLVPPETSWGSINPSLAMTFADLPPIGTWPITPEALQRISPVTLRDAALGKAQQTYQRLARAQQQLKDIRRFHAEWLIQIDGMLLDQNKSLDHLRTKMNGGDNGLLSKTISDDTTSKFRDFVSENNNYPHVSPIQSSLQQHLSSIHQQSQPEQPPQQSLQHQPPIATFDTAVKPNDLTTTEKEVIDTLSSISSNLSSLSSKLSSAEGIADLTQDAQNYVDRTIFRWKVMTQYQLKNAIHDVLNPIAAFLPPQQQQKQQSSPTVLGVHTTTKTQKEQETIMIRQTPRLQSNSLFSHHLKQLHEHITYNITQCDALLATVHTSMISLEQIERKLFYHLQRDGQKISAFQMYLEHSYRTALHAITPVMSSWNFFSSQASDHIDRELNYIPTMKSPLPSQQEHQQEYHDPIIQQQSQEQYDETMPPLSDDNTSSTSPHRTISLSQLNSSTPSTQQDILTIQSFDLAQYWSKPIFDIQYQHEHFAMLVLFTNIAELDAVGSLLSTQLLDKRLEFEPFISSSFVTNYAQELRVVSTEYQRDVKTISSSTSTSTSTPSQYITQSSFKSNNGQSSSTPTTSPPDHPAILQQAISDRMKRFFPPTLIQPIQTIPEERRHSRLLQPLVLNPQAYQTLSNLAQTPSFCARIDQAIRYRLAAYSPDGIILYNQSYTPLFSNSILLSSTSATQTIFPPQIFHVIGQSSQNDLLPIDITAQQAQLYQLPNSITSNFSPMMSTAEIYKLIQRFHPQFSFPSSTNPQSTTFDQHVSSNQHEQLIADHPIKAYIHDKRCLYPDLSPDYLISHHLPMQKSATYRRDIGLPLARFWINLKHYFFPPTLISRPQNATSSLPSTKQEPIATATQTTVARSYHITEV